MKLDRAVNLIKKYLSFIDFSGDKGKLGEITKAEAEIDAKVEKVKKEEIGKIEKEIENIKQRLKDTEENLNESRGKSEFELKRIKREKRSLEKELKDAEKEKKYQKKLEKERVERVEKQKRLIRENKRKEATEETAKKNQTKKSQNELAVKKGNTGTEEASGSNEESKVVEKDYTVYTIVDKNSGKAENLLVFVARNGSYLVVDKAKTSQFEERVERLSKLKERYQNFDFEAAKSKGKIVDVDGQLAQIINKWIDRNGGAEGIETGGKIKIYANDDVIKQEIDVKNCLMIIAFNKKVLYVIKNVEEGEIKNVTTSQLVFRDGDDRKNFSDIEIEKMNFDYNESDFQKHLIKKLFESFEEIYAGKDHALYEIREIKAGIYGNKLEGLRKFDPKLFRKERKNIMYNYVNEKKEIKEMDSKVIAWLLKNSHVLSVLEWEKGVEKSRKKAKKAIKEAKKAKRASNATAAAPGQQSTADSNGNGSTAALKPVAATPEGKAANVQEKQKSTQKKEKGKAGTGSGDDRMVFAIVKSLHCLHKHSSKDLYVCKYDNKELYVDVTKRRPSIPEETTSLAKIKKMYRIDQNSDVENSINVVEDKGDFKINSKNAAVLSENKKMENAILDFFKKHTPINQEQGGPTTDDAQGKGTKKQSPKLQDSNVVPEVEQANGNGVDAIVKPLTGVHLRRSKKLYLFKNSDGSKKLYVDISFKVRKNASKDDVVQNLDLNTIANNYEVESKDIKSVTVTRENDSEDGYDVSYKVEKGGKVSLSDNLENVIYKYFFGEDDDEGSDEQEGKNGEPAAQQISAEDKGDKQGDSDVTPRSTEEQNNDVGGEEEESDSGSESDGDEVDAIIKDLKSECLSNNLYSFEFDDGENCAYLYVDISVPESDLLDVQESISLKEIEKLYKVERENIEYVDVTFNNDNNSDDVFNYGDLNGQLSPELKKVIDAYFNSEINSENSEDYSLIPPGEDGDEGSGELEENRGSVAQSTHEEDEQRNSDVKKSKRKDDDESDSDNSTSEEGSDESGSEPTNQRKAVGIYNPSDDEEVYAVVRSLGKDSMWHFENLCLFKNDERRIGLYVDKSMQSGLTDYKKAKLATIKEKYQVGRQDIVSVDVTINGKGVSFDESCLGGNKGMENSVKKFFEDELKKGRNDNDHGSDGESDGSGRNSGEQEDGRAKGAGSGEPATDGDTTKKLETVVNAAEAAAEALKKLADKKRA